MQTNPQLELANNLINYTGSNLFLTGKAGTGKTTFLKKTKENLSKRMVVVAPTGVAAINAGGMTIHSFFQLSFGPYLPGTPIAKNELFKFKKEKINIIRSLDLLIIDEISMVRADLLDSIDNVLRHFRRNELPFGGVQLLLIGDIQQLAPVIKDEEWRILQDIYQTPYFFSSLALQKTHYACVELKKVYRQEDENFIEILNQVRENRMENSTLAELNSHYKPDFNPDDKEGYIRLTTHNATSQKINAQKLAELSTKSFFFNANIVGNFPEYAYPTEFNLELKEGTQVMFIKNDVSPEKQYFNGKIGHITYLDNNKIIVHDNENNIDIEVKKNIWENIRYAINPDTKELEEIIEGTFEQYPLKTAWAITIHKSQGLTFEKAIIDAQSSFSHGQVYVALSRCKTLDGLVLSSPLSFSSIKKDSRVESFNEYAHNLEPNETEFNRLKKDYFLRLIIEQFSFNKLNTQFYGLKRVLDEYFSKLYPELTKKYEQVNPLLKEMTAVSEKFQHQLQHIIADCTDPENEDCVIERTQKAASYFLEKLNSTYTPLIEQTADIDLDNKEIKKKFDDTFSLFKTEFKIKENTLKHAQEKFSIPKYLQEKASTMLTEEDSKNKKRTKKVSNSNDIIHQELYDRIKEWRSSLAKEQNVPAYIILNQAALISISNLLPTNDKELLKVNGIGPVTAQKYGKELLTIVDECIVQYEYEKDETLFNQIAIKGTEKKEDTKEATLQLYKEGKSIDEIAQTRGLTNGTIENHLMHYIEQGELSIDIISNQERIDDIIAHLKKSPEKTLTELKEELKIYNWLELRYAKKIADK